MPNDPPLKLATKGRLASALAATGVHGLCWAGLLVWQWNYVRLYVEAIQEASFDHPPLIGIVVSVGKIVLDNQVLTCVALAAFLAIDAWILYRLDGPSIRKVLRELWSGLVVGLPLVILFFSAIGMNLPYSKFARALVAAEEEQRELQTGEYTRLQGNWRLVETERRGRSVAEQGTLSFQKLHRQFSWTQNGQTSSGYGSLDLRKKPERIEFYFEVGPDQGKTQAGIYRVAGGELTLRVAPPGAPDDDLPEEFATQDNDCVLYRFRRAEPVPDAP